MMEIKYELTEEDYIKFNIYHAQNSKAHKKTFNILRYLLPLTCGAAVFFIGSNLFNQPKLYWGIIAILFTIFWIIGFQKNQEKIIRKSVKAMLKEGDNSSILCKYSMTINGNEIKVISEHSTEIFLKEAIKDIKVYNDMILIYLSSFMAHIIPTKYLTEEIKEKLLKELAVSQSA